VDPAEEEFLAALPPEDLQEQVDSGEMVTRLHASGELAGPVRDTFRDFAQRLTGDQQVQALLLDAYVSCYARQSQARMVSEEWRLVMESLPAIRQIRGGGTLPDVPVVIFSATTGRAREQRDMWTGFHADLAASLPRGSHAVLADTSHAVNQDRAAEIAEAINHIIDGIPPGS
jgi:CheY-like chemotaxis protein